MPPLTRRLARPLTHRLIAPLLLLLAAALLVAAAVEEKPAKPQAAAGLPDDIVQTLGGEDRYLTHLSTDKPLYREGETVYARGVILDAHDRTPLPDDQRAMATFEIVGPKGDTVARGQTASDDATLGVSWKVPEGTPGGEYTLKVSYPWQGHAPAQRKFDVRAYRAPRLKTQIVFLRDGYGPGDTVQASVDIERAEGGTPEGAKVTAIARVDGEEIVRVPAPMNKEGVATAKFDLPKEMDRGEGTLAFVIEDGGVTETATKTIPILLQTLDIQFYPEGGDLVAGVPNRVYFEARTPWGDPADLKGTIVEASPQAAAGTAASAAVAGDEDAKPLAQVETVHEGRGRFEFLPQKGKTYVLKIEQPAGITRTFELPALAESHSTGFYPVVRQNRPVQVPRAESDGFDVVRSDGVFEPGEKIRFYVSAITHPAGIHVPSKVTLRKRERLLVESEVGLVSISRGSGAGVVELNPPADATGVLIATVWDADGKPLAERLIYREPAQKINVVIEPDMEGYYPGAKPKLTVRTTDESGKPVAARVGVTVTDDSVLEMIDRRDQAPRLPAMALLESDVKELRAPHAYLQEEPFVEGGEGGKTVEPDVALDLLLGTQGWRRFAFVDPVKFIGEHGDEGRRVLAARVVTRRELRRSAPMMRFRAEGGEGEAGAADDVMLDADAVPMAAAAQELPVGDPAPDDEPAEVPDAMVERERPAAAPKPMADPADVPGQERVARGPGRVDTRQAPQGELARALDEAQGVEMDRMLLDDSEAGGGGQGAALRNDFTPVRIYAHDLRPDRRPNDRTDFTETVYWSAAVTTDDKGEASVEFALSDSVTGFRVLADAFDKRGAVGAGDVLIESVEPVYVEPKLPLMLTQGDVVRVPATMVNSTADPFQTASMRYTTTRRAPGSADGEPVAADSGESRVEGGLQPGERLRRVLDLPKLTAAPGTYDVVLDAQTDSYSDRVTRSVTVAPRGFPITLAYGGMVGPAQANAAKPAEPAEDRNALWQQNKALQADLDAARKAQDEIGDVLKGEFQITLAKHTFTIPDTVVPGSLTTEAAVYPTPLANMTEALERLVREPSGCFEQTSSTAYPLVMAQQYFLTHQGVDPALIARSDELLDRGYQKLISFETPDRGYEWFGEAPGHEALSAYGLLEFSDMAQVREVDPAMMQRTRQFILGQRDGEGNFKRERRGLHTWLADQDCSNAYITWALLSAGESPETLETEIDTVIEMARGTKNLYAVALAANVAAQADRGDAADELRAKLAKSQVDDGRVTDATQSIVGSGGQALDIETTSLAVLAWLHDPRKQNAGNIEKAMKWIAENCETGRYGSTQSTVLALKAIVEYDKSRATPKADGSVQLFLDGKPVGTPIAFTPETQGAIELPDFSDRLTPGEHTVELRMDDGSEMPYSLTVGYHAVQPANSDACPLRLTTTLSNAEVDEGGLTEANVTVTNTGEEVTPMPVALIGIPGGLEVSHDRLKELVEAGQIAAYEVMGRDVVLYWRKLDAKQEVKLALPLVAAVPGTYTGPASRTYPYYTDEHKQWQPGLKVDIAPRAK